MSKDTITIPLNGVQVRVPVSPRPSTIPAVFKTLPTAVERARAKNLWNAALALQTLIDIWGRFLICGMLRWRLAEDTERIVVERFSELEPLGRVLNLFAASADLPGETADIVAEIDRTCNIARGRTGSRRNDDPSQTKRAVQPLLATFQQLILTEAECLHRLEVNNDLYRRPWEAIRSEVEQMTAIDGDWSGETVTLDFGGALRRPQFRRVASGWKKSLAELIALLERYPSVALARPAATAPEITNTKKARVTLRKAEAERRTAEHLRQHPAASSPEIAKALGCSQGLVRETSAWKGRKANKPTSQTGHVVGRSKKVVSLDMGLEEEAIRRHEEEVAGRASDEEDDEAGAASGAPVLSREEQIKQLEREQKREQKQDGRPWRKPRQS